MKRTVLLVFAAMSVCAAVAQTPAKPATAHPATAARPAAKAAPGALPPGIPRVHGIVKTAFSLRYEDIKVGAGELAEPNKMYKVFYTGWLAADGHKFDSTDDHRLPQRDTEGKIVMGVDGKPKLGEPQPISFPQGFGRVIPGFDQGFDGMRIGGKRRIFIPWQLGYGAKGHPGPDPEHPGIPPKADLIFDVELVDVSEIKMQQPHPPMLPGAHPIPLPQGHPPVNTPKPGESTAPATTAPATTEPAQPAATAPAQAEPAKPEAAQPH